MSEARPWRRLYRTARWQRLRLHVLDRDLWTCQMPGCGALLRGGRDGADGLLRPASVDHKEPHKGDEVLFFDEENCWSLCKPCHDGRKQLIELHGFDPTVGDDGWPIDPSHPAAGR